MAPDNFTSFSHFLFFPYALVYLLRQWFSNSSASELHRGPAKVQNAGPSAPNLLIIWVWGGLKIWHFQQVLRRCGCCWSGCTLWGPPYGAPWGHQASWFLSSWYIGNCSCCSPLQLLFTMAWWYVACLLCWCFLLQCGVQRCGVCVWMQTCEPRTFGDSSKTTNFYVKATTEKTLAGRKIIFFLLFVSCDEKE